MTLSNDPANPALWTNPDWKPGTPGTFAVVIGVSDYPHLEGGSGPQAQDAYTLGQLGVCALTAYRLFDWLRDGDGYRYDDAPLAKVWLLLAPTESERAFLRDESDRAADAVDAAPRPTMEACKRAIRDWSRTMRDLPPGAAPKSRAFFLFSGHGIEKATQVLLPSDYLDPAVDSVDEAISVENLRKGLGALRVCDQFFFLDACRNDHQRLNETELEGQRVLNQVLSVKLNPDRNERVLYASASGTQAWGPTDVKHGLSLFGRALLEGLKAPEVAECDGPQCRVFAPNLQAFVSKRVAELLREFESTARQRIVLGGDRLEEPAVTFANAPSGGVGGVLAPQGARPDAERVVGAAWADHDARGLDGGREKGAWGAGGGGTGGAPEPPSRGAGPGREPIGAALHSVRARPLLGGDPVALTLGPVSHDERTRQTTAEARVMSDGPVWFKIDAGFIADAPPTRFGGVLPGDRRLGSRPLHPPVVLELFAEGDSLGDVVAVEAGLPPRLDGSYPAELRAAARLWERYEAQSAADAVAKTDLDALEDALRGKGWSALGATVAGIVLLRARALDQLHDWLRNLCYHYPEWPDGPVLWFEQRRVQSNEAPLTIEDVDWVLRLQTRALPLPFTAEAFALGDRQVRDLLSDLERTRRAKNAPPLIHALREDGQRRRALQALGRRYKKARPYFRPGGLFAVFAGPPDKVTPALVLP